MASKEEVETALHSIAARFKEAELRERLKDFKNDVVLTFTDLNASYQLHLRESSFEPLAVPLEGQKVVRVETDAATFLGILKGDINGFSAFISGKLKVHGPISDILKLQELFK